MTLSSANQIALGTFSVSSGQRASVTVNADIPDPYEPDQYTISIYGPGGRLMTNDQDGGEVYNPQTWYLPDAAPAGMYEIVLVPVNGDTGSFQVTASGISDPSASMTVGGAAVTINVPVAGERPKWTFTGTAGQNVYVQWSNACGCTTQLLGPDGTAMDTPSSGSAEIPRAALILRSGQAWWSGRPRAIRSCLGHRAVPPRGCIWRGSRANGLRYNSAEKQVKWLLPSCRTKPNLEQF
jgi:hypothetical protein